MRPRTSPSRSTRPARACRRARRRLGRLARRSRDRRSLAFCPAAIRRRGRSRSECLVRSRAHRRAVARAARPLGPRACREMGRITRRGLSRLQGRAIIGGMPATAGMRTTMRRRLLVADRWPRRWSVRRALCCRSRRRHRGLPVMRSPSRRSRGSCLVAPRRRGRSPLRCSVRNPRRPVRAPAGGRLLPRKCRGTECIARRPGSPQGVSAIIGGMPATAGMPVTVRRSQPAAR